MKKIYVFVSVLSVLFLGTNCSQKDRVYPESVTTYSSEKPTQNRDVKSPNQVGSSNREPTWFGYGWSRGDGEDITAPCKHAGTYCDFWFGICWQINMSGDKGVGPVNPNIPVVHVIIQVEDLNTNQMVTEPVFLVDRTVFQGEYGIVEDLLMKEQYLHYSSADQGYPVIFHKIK